MQETSERYPSKLGYAEAKEVARREYGYYGALGTAFALGYLASRESDHESLSIIADDAQFAAAEQGWSYFQIYAT